MSLYGKRSLAILLGAATLATAPAMAASVCIPAYQIDHTQVLKDNSIVFFMRNHKAWRAPTISPCTTLYPSTSGFTYEPTSPGSDEICSNLLTIHVNDTHETCLVGALEPYTPPQKTAAQ
jgi:hypothetical protein